MFQAGLSWPQALALTVTGSFVRRERWTAKRLFRTDGALIWVDGVPSHVVRAADFGRDEFLALDWTNMGFDQGDCIPHPNWTRLLIDETAIVTPHPFVPARTARNPPSWGDPYRVGGRTYVNRMESDRQGGFLWVHPITGATEAMTVTTIPAIPASGYGPTVILARTIPNPFTDACSVQITGTASDAMLLNTVEVPLPASFSLAAGATFALSALLRNPATQPVAALNLEANFTL